MSREFYRYRPLLRLPIWRLVRRARSCIYGHHNNLRSAESLKIQNAERKKFLNFQDENRPKIKKAAVTIGHNSEMKATSVTAMDTCGPYEYFCNTAGSRDEDSRAVYRRLRSDDGNHVQPESLVLDIDQLMREISNMSALGRMRPSLDHTMLAFTIELEGHEDEGQSRAPSSGPTAALYVKDIERNVICKIDIHEVLRSDAYDSAQEPAICPSIVDFDWAVDATGHALLYLVLDDELYRPSLVVALDIGALSTQLFHHDTTHTHEGSSAVLLKDFGPSKDDFKYVLRERDGAFNVDVGRSKDDKFVIISSHSKVSSEVSIIPIPVVVKVAGECASSPGPGPGPGPGPFLGPLILQGRQRGVKYYVDHSDSFFYIATNRPSSYASAVQGITTSISAPILVQDMTSNLSIIRCPSALAMQYAMQNETSFAGWQRVYPPKSRDADATDGTTESSTVVSDFDIFIDKIVVYGRRNGFPSVRVLDLAAQSRVTHRPSDCISFVDLTQQIREEVGSEMFCISVGMNAYDSSTATFSVSSPIVQEMHFAIDLVTSELRRNNCHVRSKESVDRIRSGKYHMVTETASSSSGDCVSVPITVVTRRCTAIRNGSMADPHSVPNPHRVPGPFLLIGYGAYGIPLSVEYDPQVMTLLQRGFSVGYAHCRGGGEYGSHWHTAGKGMLKWNTFNDFAACAEHLISRGYTSPSLLCGMGSSAGGLVMGVMANEFPHLFAALVMRHPFLDPYETLQRPDLPLTVHEYDEYGNPDDPQTMECIRSYSPCSNVGAGVGDRPAMFLSTGLQDTRVGPWEALKWTEMLRDSPTANTRSVLLSVTPRCGHNGPSDPDEDNWLKAAEIIFLENSIDTLNNSTRTVLKGRSGRKNGRKRL